MRCCVGVTIVSLLHVFCLVVSGLQRGFLALVLECFF